MPHQHCTNFPDIAQEKSWANIEQKDKIVRNSNKYRIYELSHELPKDLRSGKYQNAREL